MYYEGPGVARSRPRDHIRDWIRRAGIVLIDEALIIIEQAHANTIRRLKAPRATFGQHSLARAVGIIRKTLSRAPLDD